MSWALCLLLLPKWSKERAPTPSTSQGFWEVWRCFLPPQQSRAPAGRVYRSHTSSGGEGADTARHQSFKTGTQVAGCAAWKGRVWTHTRCQEADARKNFNRKGKVNSAGYSLLSSQGWKNKGRETRTHKNFSEGENIFKACRSESLTKKMPAAVPYDGMAGKQKPLGWTWRKDTAHTAPPGKKLEIILISAEKLNLFGEIPQLTRTESTWSFYDIQNSKINIKVTNFVHSKTLCMIM